MMNQNSSQKFTVFSRSYEFSDGELIEVKRLLTHIEQTAIDSENTPIDAREVAMVTDRVVERIVWRDPHLQQVIQEALDDLRFGT